MPSVLTLLGILATPLVVGFQTPSFPPTSTPAVDALLTSIEETYRAMDVERFVAHFTDDFRQVDVNRRIEIAGIDAWRRQTERINAAHREMTRTHHGRLVQGDRVVVEIEWTGTLRGTEFGSDAPDRSYRFEGLGILELDGDRVRSQRLYIDYATYLEQIEGAPQSGPPPAPGRLIDIGGRRLHLHCLGAGGPTVVVDAGAGNWSLQWMHLHEPLAKDGRVCLYDRAGIGWSDPSTGPATSERAAADLVRLLDAAGERGPFIHVGHSYGGYVSRSFRRQRPDLVAGIVLVESGHEDQWSRLPPPLTEITRAAVPDLRAYATALRSGADVPAQPIDAAFTDSLQRRMLEGFSRDPGQYEELANVIEAMDSTTAMLRRTGPLGDVPLLVISADLSFDAFAHLPIDVAASNAVWATLQKELAGLSRCSRQLRSPTGDHNLQLTDPALVVDGIRRLRQTLRTHRGAGCPLTSGNAGSSWSAWPT